MGGRELNDKNFIELETLGAAGVATGDYIPVYDASADQVKRTLVAANVAAVSATTATTLTTAMALANANKTAINSLLTALKNANLQASS